MRAFEALWRTAAILVLIGAVAALGFHHHEAESPEPHCALCHFVVFLTFGALALVALFSPQQVAWAVPQPPDLGPSRLGLSACGLRAPPVL